MNFMPFSLNSYLTGVKQVGFQKLEHKEDFFLISQKVTILFFPQEDEEG